MFGSNFFTNFGIPEFSGIDAQGGMFGTTAPQPGQMPGQAELPGGPITPPATQTPASPPGAAALSAGPLALGGGQTPPPQPDAGPPAPAAGVSSPFGKPNA